MLELMKYSLHDALSRRNFFARLTRAGVTAATAPTLLELFAATALAHEQQEQRQDAKRQTLETKTSFWKWIESEGIPIYQGYTVADLNQSKLGPWKRLGVQGAIVYLHGDGGLVSGYLAEMEPGKKTATEKHMYEEHMFVLSGSGETRVWYEGKPRVMAKWKAGSLFSIPVNATHEHVNTGSTPARLFGATTAPLIIDLYRNLDFVFNNNFHFTDRFNSQPNFYDPELAKTTPPEGQKYAFSQTNLIPDVLTQKLYVSSGHGMIGSGVGMANHHFTMAGDMLDAHIEEAPSGVYERGHRHAAGSNVLIVQGTGYSLIWPPELGRNPFRDGHGDKVVRVPFQPGTLFVPPLGWFHQHFNTGATPMRFVKVIGFGSRVYPLTSYEIFLPGAITIEYGDEDPKIREMFEAELQKNGVRSLMPSVEELSRQKAEHKHNK
ncbi:MAG: cupin domain-containing protein [Blastocatellia bacterium]